MSAALQTLLIGGAAVATFAGVYVLTPSAESEPVAAAPAVSPDPVASPADDAPNPLAPAAKGLVECATPNERRKRCRAISVYRALGRGHYSSTALMIASNGRPTITFELSSPVSVKSGQVCGTLTGRDIARASFYIDGEIVSDEEAVRALATVVRAMGDDLGKEYCVSYVGSGDDLTGRVTLGGKRRPELDQKVKWVRPQDGYKVG